MDNSQINKIFRIHIGDDGEAKKYLVGKYMLENGNFHVLEDHADLFRGANSGGPVTPDIQAQLDGFESNSHYQVQNVDDPDHYLENLPENTIADLHSLHQKITDENPEIEFNLSRDGVLYRLVYNGKTGQYTLNNSSVSGYELENLLEEIRNNAIALEAVG